MNKHISMKKIGSLVLITLLLICSSALAADSPVLMMATTSSTDDTGLLDYLAPLIVKAIGIEVRWTAVGTGKALKMGENCDVDVLLVHAPTAEAKFVADSFGIERREIMYNDFVLLGPASDPAGIRGKSVAEALGAIAAKEAVFTSRGDKSGTHQKELEMWQQSKRTVPEKEGWYIQTGQGMLTTINMAAERLGYTMTDRGTFIKYESDHGGKPPLVVLVEGDALLRNQYSVILVNPAKCAQTKTDLARKFSDYLAGADGQKAIGGFMMMGKQLFVPNAH